MKNKIQRKAQLQRPLDGVSWSVWLCLLVVLGCLNICNKWPDSVCKLLSSGPIIVWFDVLGRQATQSVIQSVKFDSIMEVPPHYSRSTSEFCSGLISVNLSNLSSVGFLDNLLPLKKKGFITSEPLISSQLGSMLSGFSILSGCEYVRDIACKINPRPLTNFLKDLEPLISILCFLGGWWTYKIRHGVKKKT